MSMRRLVATVAALALVAFAAPAGAKVTVKLGTVAPDGSPWHKLLKELSRTWAQESGGEVDLKIFAGGVAGNEGDMIRKMRVGQLQSAAITVIGLHDIDSAMEAITVPGMIRDEAELAHVLSRVGPRWEQRLADKGFVVLAWGDTGWAYLFSKKPVKTPADAHGMKLFTWAGDPKAAEAWRAVGFTPVVLSSTDIVPSLTTGMIEGVVNSPIMAYTARWYENAGHMPTARFGRLLGAVVIKKDTWEQIPADLRPKLLASARAAGARIDQAVSKMNDDAIAAMEKRGMTVVKLSPAEQAEWERMLEKAWPVIRGGTVPAEEFDLVKQVRDQYRAGK
jgi:TRAP-type C4-dicarboxylate transport system substrate-binding protein